MRECSESIPRSGSGLDVVIARRRVKWSGWRSRERPDRCGDGRCAGGGVGVDAGHN